MYVSRKIYLRLDKRLETRLERRLDGEMIIDEDVKIAANGLLWYK